QLDHLGAVAAVGGLLGELVVGLLVEGVGGAGLPERVAALEAVLDELALLGGAEQRQDEQGQGQQGGRPQPPAPRGPTPRPEGTGLTHPAHRHPPWQWPCVARSFRPPRGAGGGGYTRERRIEEEQFSWTVPLAKLVW